MEVHAGELGHGVGRHGEELHLRTEAGHHLVGVLLGHEHRADRVRGGEQGLDRQRAFQGEDPAVALHRHPAGRLTEVAVVGEARVVEVGDPLDRHLSRRGAEHGGQGLQHGRRVRGGEVDDAEVDARPPPPRSTCASMAAGSSASTPQVRGDQDLRRVAADLGAALVEHLDRGRELLRAIRPGGSSAGRSGPPPAACAFGPLPPMQIGGCGLLHRLGLAAGVAAAGSAARRRSTRSLVSRLDDHLERLVEAVEPLLERRQVDAVGVALLLVPPGAEARARAGRRR